MDLKNCLTTTMIKCEPKTRRLGKTKYNRPKEGTFTDTLQTKKKIHSKYVVLSNGSFTWSVQRYHWKNETDEEPVFETAFFRILSKEEQLQKKIDKQKAQIDRLTKHIRNNQ